MTDELTLREKVLEEVRVKHGWPKDGVWDFDLSLNQWRYQYATGPDTFSITVGTTGSPAHMRVAAELRGEDQ